MNPYEKYYLRKKIITGAVTAGAVVVIGGALLLLKPWNWIPENSDPPPVTDQQPPVTDPVPENEPDLSITVGGKKVDCRLYQGDGWTIPVPMDWEIEELDGKVCFYPKGSSADGTCLTVSVTDDAAYKGSFIAVAAKKFSDETRGKERMFYFGGERGIEVRGTLREEDLEDYEKTMTAMARTMTVGKERPFASLYPMASEPEWQVVDGEVVLFLDKDGIDIEGTAEKAVQTKMNAWSSDIKANFTGKYRLGEPAWDSSYTCVSDQYIDVFCVTVQYQVAAGRAEYIELGEGQQIKNGWLTDENAVLYIAVYHDGSVVSERVSAWGNEDYFGAEFASGVLK
ncbi:MAG: hypothetical protein IKM11_06115 [Oscillospiraceae bacterium]|nr:hypothetical protein [Oscillospiraceae bacterium]